MSAKAVKIFSAAPKAFNSKYILDILKNLSDEEAIMELNNSLSPVCIKPVGEENYIYIVTPVRVVF